HSRLFPSSRVVASSAPPLRSERSLISVMIDGLLYAAAAIGASFLALTCLGGGNSSKHSHYSSMDRAPDERESRKGLTVIEAENINADVKAKSIEDEKKEVRRRQAREFV
ncbi:hypothetical protein PMAYCL1PPCAC_19771, partial [Pristionchus mayeri]